MFPSIKVNPPSWVKESVGKPLSWLVFSGYAVLIAFLSLASIAPQMKHDSDKLAHFLAYCGFAMLAVFVVRGKPQYIICCLLIVLYGGLLEFAQSFFPYRSMSVFDFMANSIGVGVGYVLANIFLDRRWFNA